MVNNQFIWDRDTKYIAVNPWRFHFAFCVAHHPLPWASIGKCGINGAYANVGRLKFVFCWPSAWSAKRKVAYGAEGV